MPRPYQAKPPAYHHSSQSHETLRNQADTWIAKLNSDKSGKREQQAFSQWLMQDPANKDIFDQQLDLYQQLGQLAGLSALELAKVNSPKTSSRATNGFGNVRFEWLGLALASAAILVFGVGNMGGENIQRLHYSTGAGETRSIELSDGSRVQLNTRSSLSVAFSATQRDISLHKGEAYFEVAKNPNRPFSVDLGNGSVTAVGTAFNIHRHANFSQVQVTEGVVAVASSSSVERAPPQIQAGKNFTLNNNGLSAVKNLDTAPDWLDGSLDFNNVPLREVIADLNRYLATPVRLELSVAELQLPVSGHFNLHEADATLRALVTGFDLQLNTQGEERIISARY